ncbi:hypothetical protein [Roseateles sp. MS654]|uniref:hypothetical protein n=1 Tax=Roseateles sp. MS654 TaxID=3412685 RepID=UPI003C2F2A15
MFLTRLFGGQPAASASQSWTPETQALDFDGFEQPYPLHQRGADLYEKLEGEIRRSAPAAGFGTLGQNLPTRLEHHTAAQPGNEAPLRGHCMDDGTLLLAAPSSKDTSGLIRLIGALMEHNVGLIVDLSTGQDGLNGPHGLSSNWSDELPGYRAAVSRRVTDPSTGDVPDGVAADQLNLMMQRLPEATASLYAPQKVNIGMLTLTAPFDRNVLPAGMALQLAQHCQQFRERYRNERIAFLSNDGLGPTVALAGAERLFRTWQCDGLRRNELNDRVLQLAGELRKQFGPFATMPTELTTLADLYEYLANIAPPGRDPQPAP